MYIKSWDYVENIFEESINYIYIKNKILYNI